MLFIVFWFLACSYVFHSSPTDNALFSIIFFAFGAAFLNSVIGWNVFRNRLLHCANVILGISLVVHFLHSFGIIGASPYHFKTGEDYVMSLLIFHTEWGEISTPIGRIYRFSSVFWEAGQAQIVVFFILMLFTDDLKKHLFNLIYILKKYGILIVAILLTGSTTGYLVFMIYGIWLILFSSASKKTKILLPFFLLVATAFAFLIFTSSVVQEKISQSSSYSEVNSFTIRMADNLACLRAAKENPIVGLGYNTPILFTTLSKYGSLTSSNGILRAMSAFGILVISFILYIMGKRIRQMNFGIPSILLLSCLILAQCNEYFMFFPYLFIYLFKFRK